MSETDPGQALLRMITGGWVTQIVGTLAALGIPDQLQAGPADAGAVATAVGSDPDATLRLMRAAAALGVLSAANGQFGLTPLGSMLTCSAPNSLRNAAILFSSPCHWLPWGRLLDTVRSGMRQTQAALGAEIFPYLNAHPDEAAVFFAAMSDLSRMRAGQIAAALDPGEARYVVDVGGADGTLIAAVLKAHPHLTGAVFDQPQVAEAARANLRSQGLEERCAVLTGDFFEGVPPADLILLKQVIHDWDDAQSVRILANCAAALRPQGRIAVVEMVLSEEEGSPYPALMDVNMLAITTGRERSRSDYIALLTRAGLRFRGLVPTTGPTQILWAERAA